MSDKPFGSANPTPVGPTGKRVRTERNVTPPKSKEFRIRDEGKGPHVTDVTYDENLRTLSVRRAGHQTANIDSIRFGTVQNPALALGPVDVTQLEGPERWFPPNTGNLTQDKSPTLLPEYKHGDAMPTEALPAGFAYVRLQAGSLPVESSSWDADQEVYGVETEAPRGFEVGVVAASLTERGSAADYTKAKITLWYSHRIVPRVPGGYTLGSLRLFEVTSNKSPIKVSSVVADPDHKNALILTLTRPVVLTETLRLRVKGASAYAYSTVTTKKPTVESALLNVSIKLARNCYVLVVNRTDSNLAVGDKVIIGKPLTVFDKPTSESIKSTGLPAYDVIVTGGGASAPPALATIVGGNATPTTPEATADPDNTIETLDEQGYLYDTAYPAVRPFSFPLPLILKGKLRTLPRVKNWAKYTLPISYSFGDKLPRCPDGLCYVRLERPFTLADSSWSSAFSEGLYVASTESYPQFVTAATAKSGFSTVYLYFDKDCSLNSTRQPIQVSVTAHDGISLRPAVGVLRYTLDVERKAVTLVLSRPLDPELEDASVFIPKNVIQFGSRPTQVNPSAILSIVYSADKFSMCIGLNRNAVQGFGYGDLVLLHQSPVVISDEQGVGVSCYEIISPAGPAVPTHTHQTAGGGRFGGGPAFIGAKV